MGLDISTVKKIPKEDQHKFDTIHDEKGSFPHSEGITGVISLLGINLMERSDRLQDSFDENGNPEAPHLVKGVPLTVAMCWNFGLQVTPNECLKMARAINESDAKLMAAIGVSATNYYGQFPTFYTDDDWNNEKTFLKRFAKFCEESSKCGGFFVW